MSLRTWQHIVLWYMYYIWVDRFSKHKTPITYLSKKTYGGCKSGNIPTSSPPQAACLWKTYEPARDRIPSKNLVIL